MMIALFIVLAANPFEASPAGAADFAKIVQDLEASWPAWFPNLDQCPADLMPVIAMQPRSFCKQFQAVACRKRYS
jgi:hypothetical protein